MPFSALKCPFLHPFLSIFRENLSEQNKSRLRKVLYLSFLGENLIAERYSYNYYNYFFEGAIFSFFYLLSI